MSVRERQTWEQLEGMLSEALTPLGLTRGMHQGCEEAMKGHSESACRMRVEWFGGSLWEITVLAANTTDHRKRHLYWRIFSHFLQSPEAAMDGIPTPM